MAIVGLGGCVLLGFLTLAFAGGADDGGFEFWALVWPFVVFTAVTMVPAFALWSYGKRYLPGVALGLLIGWAGAAAALGWIGGAMAVSAVVESRGPAAVTAFDALTGERRWEAPLEGFDGVGMATTWGGLVFLQTGRSAESTAGSVVALDARTGRQVWQVDTVSTPVGCGGAAPLGEPPVVADGVTVVRASGVSIRGIDARSGSERWRAEVDGAPAAATDGVVVLGGRNVFTALDLATGAQRWTRTIPEAASGDALPGGRAVTVGAGPVFLVELATGESFSIAALEAGTGRELWREPVGSLDSSVQRYVVDGADTLIALEAGAATVAFSDHRVTARDLRTGRLRWSKEKLPLAPSMSPRTAIAAADGRAFYASIPAGLIAVDARSGGRRWTSSFPYDQDGFLFEEFPPRLTAGQDVAAARHMDRLSVVDAGTGVQRWTTRLDSGGDLETTPAIGEGLVLLPRSSSSCA